MCAKFCNTGQLESCYGNLQQQVSFCKLNNKIFIFPYTSCFNFKVGAHTLQKSLQFIQYFIVTYIHTCTYTR
jgi:hypothetical protein